MPTPFPSDTLLIDGRWRRATATREVEDPSTGEVLGAIADAGADAIDEAVAAGRRALAGPWGTAEALDRARLLRRLGTLVERDADGLAHAEARDVGKPLGQARADVRALARYCEFYAGAAEQLGGVTIPFRAGYTAWTVREPHGVTGHIVPWNYPMQIIGRSVVAALAAGNAAVLKPAEDASLTALWFGRLAVEAGLPAGALAVVPGSGAVAGAALAEHGGIDHLSFTGSGEVGARVQAAAAANAVPVTLELGGKSPQLIFADADVNAALPLLVGAGLQNAGQTCSAGSRVLVERARYDEVVERMAARYRGLVTGPALADRDLGPLISARQHGRVGTMIAGRTPVAAGRIEAGVPERGHYMAPMLFADVAPEDGLAQDEVFGPVQVVIPFDDEEHAVALANGTRYGLVAGVWTKDGARALRLVRRLRAGQVFLNDYGAAGGVELPFGGVGGSGHGREKGMEGLMGFTRVKTVVARHG